MGPLTTKDEIKAEVEAQMVGINFLKTIVDKSDELITTPYADGYIASKYDNLNFAIQSSRKTAVKDLLEAHAGKLRELGRAVGAISVGLPDPVVPTYVLYSAPFAHKQNIIDAIDVQTFDCKVVLHYLVDHMPESMTSPTTTGSDPRVAGVFSALLTDDQQDYRQFFMLAAFIYADNLTQLAANWV